VPASAGHTATEEAYMRVLVICDDYYHPASVVHAGLSLMEGHSLDYIEDAADWSAERMATYPAVIYAKSDNITAANRDPWVTPAVEQAFGEYVRGGGGLLAIHSGTVYKALPGMRALLGGAFDFHPKQCPVTIEPVPGHPLAAGVTPFTEVDEHYRMIMDDPAAEVFLIARSEHGEQPGGWTRQEGAGRVCVLTPGHTVEVFAHPSFLRLISNGLTWCAPQA